MHIDLSCRPGEPQGRRCRPSLKKSLRIFVTVESISANNSGCARTVAQSCQVEARIRYRTTWFTGRVLETIGATRLASSPSSYSLHYLLRVDLNIRLLYKPCHCRSMMTNLLLVMARRTSLWMCQACPRLIQGQGHTTAAPLN